MGNPEIHAGGSPVTEYVPEPVFTGPGYMTVDGINDYLVVDHTEALSLGQNNADFTVSFAMHQVVEADGAWKNLIHKGNSNGERTPAIWRYTTNTGLHPRCTTTGNSNDGIGVTAVMNLNQWYYITYLKQGR